MDDATVIVEEANPVCGDRLRLALRTEGDRIVDTKFLAYGCAATIACGSALTELIKGIPVGDAKLVDRSMLVEAVGKLPSRKQHAAALAIETLRTALEKLE
jgi:nitrogen fixation protein NifU and related proteins